MTQTKPRPFDERAALEELERLAEKIQSTRRQRERAVAEFNAFVKTFKDDDHAVRLAALQPPVRIEPPAQIAPPAQIVPPVPPSPLAPVVERRSAEPPPISAALPAPPASPIISVDSDTGPIAWTAPKRQAIALPALMNNSRVRIALAAAGLLVVVLLVTWMWSGSSSDVSNGEPADAPAAQTAPPASPPAATPTPTSSTPTPTPVASTGPPRALNMVLVTSRPVWTRVIVDDRKVIERELPGLQTIPLAADRAIAIRAGDAGAIRLIVDGKDIGVLGRNGQIASRAFTARAPTNR